MCVRERERKRERERDREREREERDLRLRSQALGEQLQLLKHSTIRFDIRLRVLQGLHDGVGELGVIDEQRELRMSQHCVGDEDGIVGDVSSAEIEQPFAIFAKRSSK